MDSEQKLFRAWVGDKMRMCGVYNDLAIFDLSITYDPLNESEVRNFDYKSINEVELMDYTYADDENGVNVFSGDFLRSTDSGDVGIVWFDQDLLQYMVHDVSTERDRSLLDVISDGAAVVGNFHENPELLK